MLSSTIEINGEQKLLEAFASALEPEKDDKNSRASYTIKLNKKLVIEISAKDVTSFRAINNTITGLMSIVEKSWSIEND